MSMCLLTCANPIISPDRVQTAPLGSTEPLSLALPHQLHLSPAIFRQWDTYLSAAYELELTDRGDRQASVECNLEKPVSSRLQLAELRPRADTKKCSTFSLIMFKCFCELHR